MLGTFIRNWKQFMDSFRDEDFNTRGFAGVISEVPTFTLTTAGGARTLTVSELFAGFMLVNCDDAQNLVTPTAALIVAGLKGAEVGSSFEFVIRNTGDSTLTVTAGTGVTLSGTMTVGTLNQKRFLVRVTAITTPAVTIYSQGTSVF
jgi:hypothetical protein